MHDVFFVKNVVLYGHFVICICPCLVCIDVASVKQYLNATKAKQGALNARKPLVGGREPHLCSRPSEKRLVQQAHTQFKLRSLY